MLKPLVSFITALLIAESVCAAPSTVDLLAPSSPWHVNYADDSCRLARTFGTGDDLTFLVLDRFAPGQDFKMVLAGKRLRISDYAKTVSFRFGPNEPEQNREIFKGDLGQGRPAIIVRGSVRLDGSQWKQSGESYVPPAPMQDARIAAVTQLIVEKPLWKPLTLSLGSMKKPIAAVDKCTVDLLVKWGVDPVRHATLSRTVTPISQPQTWLNSNDYPPSAYFSGAQGIVDFRLAVDDAGVPSGCHIQQSTRPPEFDNVVCKAMMRRARFEPALDKDGKPLPSYYRGSVNFQIAR